MFYLFPALRCLQGKLNALSLLCGVYTTNMETNEDGFSSKEMHQKKTHKSNMWQLGFSNKVVNLSRRM